MKTRFYAMAATLTGLTMIIGCTGNPSGTSNTNPTPTPGATATPAPTPTPQNSWAPLPFTGFPEGVKLTGRVLGSTETWNVLFTENVTGALPRSEISPTDGNGYFWFFSPEAAKTYYYQFKPTEPFAAHPEPNIVGSAISSTVVASDTPDATTPQATVNLDWNGENFLPAPGSTIKVGEPVTFTWAEPKGWEGATCSLKVYKQSTRAFSEVLKTPSDLWFSTDVASASPLGVSGHTYTWNGYKNFKSTVATESVTGNMSVVITYGPAFKPGSLTSKNLQYTKQL